MAKMYTTSKTNPITGMSTDNNPRQEKRQARKEEKALNKSLNEGIKKQKVDKSIKTTSYKGIPVEEKKQPKDWRNRSKVGALLHGTPIPHKDKGGEKNMSTKTPSKKKGLGIVPKSCRGPKEWTR